ncbi:uncharacterized protein KY384_000202 [Bacidia gigantensis]|uniref:uncharacterized protein n=1 Tax=Bacidia gigantensis TaxID=2732470 RepID=UPI001D0366FB|nr:uncharacterized protein KY384_000202 [Bacidia gigantensis]KAG8526209.1 hypothetical protein KY384_000202 [Bacidia gigantensis]
MRAVLAFLLTASVIQSFSQAAFLPDSISDATSRLSRSSWGQTPKHERPPVQDSYPKYFHEPNGDEALNHYDDRYHHHVLGYDEKTDTQVHLIRSYLEFFRKNGMETWLAHGTLLGWWWNSKMLPWDWDIDTQISVGTLLHLADNHNATFYNYKSDDTEVDPATSKSKPITRKYHLDVNPAIYVRMRNSGANIIDARWIDVRNGLYIDITAVAEIHPEVSPGMWLCKNYHRYRTRDLWPMRETMYEGAVAKVPYAYNQVLSREYGDKALVTDEYQGHKWSLADRVWVKKTPKEIEQERNDRQAQRRKKQEEKAEEHKDEELRRKNEQILEDEEERQRRKDEEKEKQKETAKHVKITDPDEAVVIEPGEAPS